MRLRSIFATGLYLSLIPLVGATGTWTEPMAAAPFTKVEAPTLSTTGTAQTAPAATEPPIRAARLEQRDASGGLSNVVAAIGRAEGSPVWVAWTGPIQKHEGRSSERSWYHDVNRCVLDDDGNFRESHGVGDDAERLVIFARLANRSIDRVAIADSRCTVDAGAKTVYFLEGVVPAQSVALMAGLVRQEAADKTVGDDDHDRRPHGRRQALVAVALTADPSADRVLEEFVAGSNPRWLRRDAAFWLGAARGATGAAIVERLARTDQDSRFREHLTFVLSLTGDHGIDTLIDLARNDAAANVRGQALFWLGQKAGERAVRALRTAVDNDPDHDVRVKAVFAISQLPRDESVPRLIELARTHRDPEVRKQAMFWLGQTGDPRAVEFFEAVLKK